MANYNAAFEHLIAEYRKNRPLLTINNISFKATRAEFETAAREKCRNPDALIFFWPPTEYSNLRHKGCVHLGLETRDHATKQQEPQPLDGKIPIQTILAAASTPALAPAPAFTVTSAPVLPTFAPVEAAVPPTSQYTNASTQTDQSQQRCCEHRCSNETTAPSEPNTVSWDMGFGSYFGIKAEDWEDLDEFMDD
ncbi:unnamed protein product [Clonostachys solani]|uniref:Uncharacterized protein n=1 Tax=Clonostachys solani TaxID=160281 RepID=A0A9N9W3V2_9HYPO|nr:unnamed protein product [Clonostachys solani]